MEWINLTSLDAAREQAAKAGIVIFGLGRCGSLAHRHLTESGVPVAAFADNAATADRHNGVPVLRPAEAVKQHPGGTFIIALRRAEHIRSAAEQLEKLGVHKCYGAGFLADAARGTGSAAANYRIDEQVLAAETAGLHGMLSGELTAEKLAAVGNPRLLETFKTDHPARLELLPAAKRNDSAGLAAYAKDVYSYAGVDGILAEIFRRLGPTTGGTCMEFGGHDGKTMSNTFNLIENAGWRGIMIEPDPVMFKMLQKTSAEVGGRIECVRGFVGIDRYPALDSYLVGRPRLDLLSIDVDGMDYHIWAGLTAQRPRVVIIEYNALVAADVLFVQAKNEDVFEGSSAAALRELGTEKDYGLVAATADNLIFVDNAEWEKLSIPAGMSLEQILPAPYRARLVQAFNGKIYTLGTKPFLIREYRTVGPEEMQIFPEFSAE